jgi:hypothetical protein
MSKNTAHKRTLHRALEACGNIYVLADALGASVADVATWLNGEVRAPDFVFTTALDLVNRGPAKPVRSA